MELKFENHVITVDARNSGVFISCSCGTYMKVKDSIRLTAVSHVLEETGLLTFTEDIR